MRILSLLLLLLSSSSFFPGAFGHGAPQRLEFSLQRRPRSSPRRSLRQGFQELARIAREPDGVYWSDLRIGPRKEDVFSVIVDTGSSTIAVPCAGCSCGEHNHFDPAMSPGAEIIGGSTYRQCYSEGSCNVGRYVQAKMCLGRDCDVELEGVEHRFGCCSRFANAFRKQFADGIIGMSGSSGTFAADLRAHHKLENDLFSLCLSHTEGVLGVGGYDQTRHLEPIQWIPMRIGSFYNVNVRHLYLNGKVLPLSRSPTSPIVDSGTTFTYVEPFVHDALRTAFDQFCSQAGNCPGHRNPSSAAKEDLADAVVCYEPRSEEDVSNHLDKWFEKFPSLELEFEAYQGNAARLCIPPATYFFKSKNAYCVGLLRDRRRKSFVLGALTMSGFDYVFDHGSNRLGMARSICNKNRDGDLNARNSVAECCGTCTKAQRMGYNSEHFGKTSKPTPNPTTQQPTTPPPTRIKMAFNKTVADGNFQISKTVAQYPGKTVIIPVEGTGWSTAAFSFSKEHVLLLQNSVTICSQQKEEKGWNFDKDALVVVSGPETLVTLGANCIYPELRVQDGAKITTPNLDGERRELDEMADVTLQVANRIDLRVAQLEVLPNTIIEFESASTGIKLSTGSAITVQHGASLLCPTLTEDQGLRFMDGTVDLKPGSSVFCYVLIGPGAELKLRPDESGDFSKAASIAGPLEIMGTIEFGILRDPFRAFSLNEGGSIVFHGENYHPKIKIVLSGDVENDQELFHDLPEKARLFSVRDVAYITSKPESIEMASILECAKTTLDSTFSQIIFTSQECLNKCIDDPDDECSLKELEFYPWPPSSDGLGTGENGDLLPPSTWLSQKIAQVSSNPHSKQALAWGSITGIVVAIIVFMAMFGKLRCFCWKRRNRHTYDSI